MYPVEAWRIMMAVKCDIPAQIMRPLSVLNIFLPDDSSVHYLGLTPLPNCYNIFKDQ